MPKLTAEQKQLNEARQKLETLADYVEELISQELAEAGLIDEGAICIDYMELALYNDYLQNLFNIRVELRKRIEAVYAEGRTGRKAA